MCGFVLRGLHQGRMLYLSWGEGVQDGCVGLSWGSSPIEKLMSRVDY